MIRLAAFAALVLAVAPARADDPAAAPFRIIDARVASGKLEWEEARTVAVPVVKQVQVVENGMVVVKNAVFMELVTVADKQAIEVKDLKATDVAGKAVAADTLADLLKEKTPVVLMTGPLPVKHRGLFKDKTVFVELPPPPPEVGPKK
jgi:hypothetical protein